MIPRRVYTASCPACSTGLNQTGAQAVRFVTPSGTFEAPPRPRAPETGALRPVDVSWCRGSARPRKSGPRPGIQPLARRPNHYRWPTKTHGGRWCSRATRFDLQSGERALPACLGSNRLVVSIASEDWPAARDAPTRVTAERDPARVESPTTRVHDVPSTLDASRAKDRRGGRRARFQSPHPD